MTWRILYVDDEPDLREVAQMSLELDPELEVTSCASGEAAIALLAGQAFDLVLLDVMMPGMDGPTTFERIREAGHAAVPVVFITARASADDVARLIRLGAKAVIAKPFDPISLAAQVRSHLDG